MIIRPKYLSTFITLMILAALAIAAGGVIGYHARAYLRIHDSHRSLSSSFNLLRTTILVDNLSFREGGDRHGVKLAGSLEIFDAGIEDATRPLVVSAASYDRPRATTIDSLVRDIRNELDAYNALRVQLSSRQLGPEAGLAARARLDISLVGILTMLNVIEQHTGKLLDDRRLALERALIAFGLFGFIFCAVLAWQLFRLIRNQWEAYYQVSDSEQQLRALFLNLPDTIMLLDAESRIRVVNRTSNDRHRTGEAGTSAVDLFEPKHRSQIKDATCAVLRDGTGAVLPGMKLIDGTICSVRLIPLSPSDNSETVMAVMSDVSEGHRAKRDLKLSEQKYRSLFHNAQAGLVRISNDTGLVVECNSNFAEMLGYTGPDECIGELRVEDLCSDKATCDAITRALQQKGEVSHVTLEFERPNGQRAWLSFSARSYVDDGFTEGVMVDITRQRTAEHESIESTERYRLIFEESPISLWEEDLSDAKRYCDALKLSGVADLRDHFANNPEQFAQCLNNIEILRVNKATREMLGELTPKDFLCAQHRHMDEETFTKMGNALVSLVEGQTRISSSGVFFASDGRRIDVSVDIRVPEQHCESLSRVFVSVIDVSDQRHAERALLDNRERLDLALRSVRDGLWEFFVETGRMSFDELCGRIQCLSPDDMPRTFDDWQEMIHPEDRPLVLGALGDHLAGVDRQFQCEYRVKQKGGVWIWILDRGCLAAAEDGGKALKIIGTRSDIHARKCAEIAQRESEHKWRAIAENSSDYIAVTDVKGVIRYINRVDMKRDRQEVIGHNFTEFTQTEFRQDILQAISEAYNTGETVDVEVKGTMFDDEVRLFHVRIGRLDPYSESEACALSVTDVTEQRQTTQALLESEERFDLAVKGSHDGLWDWLHIESNDDMWWSPRLYEMFGYDPGTLRPTINFIFDNVLEDDSTKVRTALEKHLVDRMPLDIDFRMRVKNGEARWFRMRGQALWNSAGEAFRIAGSIRDETDRRLAEQALRDSEATLMSILTAAPTGIGIVSNRIIKWASDELVNMLGYARDEIIGRSARFLYTTREEFQRVGDVKYRLMAEHGVGEVETQWVRKDGRVIDIVLRSSPIDPQNPSAGVSFTALDITAMKRTQKALVDSEHKVKELFDCMPDGMLLTALDGTIIDANPAFIAMLGLSLDEMLKQGLPTLATDRWQRTIHEGLSTVCRIGSAEFEIELTHRDSRQVPVSVSLWSMSNDYGEVTRVGGVIRDITVRRRMEEELVKREKLESVGQLAGGIAHDFNNLLTAILGNISLARIDCKDPHISIQLDDAERATERARSLTQQLLTFSKGGDPIRKATSIVDLVRESASFVVRGSRSRIVFDFDESIGPISVDEGQITQVIYNLVINADQAMPNGGTIGIRVSQVRIDAVRQPELHPGNYTCIAVSDEGGGIPTENISKIFDPFYTTKPGGSGLGLATTYSIVKKHGGTITVDSTISVGSTFRVFLRNTPVSDDVRTVMQGDFSGGREHGRILFMDDEEVIRQVAGRALTKAGYDVEFAHDGLQAVSSFKRAMREGLRFDVVILDLTIPGGMGGKDTIAALRLIDPDIRAIVSSGYSNDPVSANFRDFGFAEAVHKPYKPQHLVEAVRNVIESGKTAGLTKKPTSRHE